MSPGACADPTPGWTVALLGAECTGKSTLAHTLSTALQAALAALPGPSPLVAWVPEALRQWCDTQHRLPLAHEQANVARLQLALVAAARERVGPSGWLVVDTTPLQTAVYSQHYFGDTTLCPHAQQQQHAFDVTLLMGLDLPWQADGHLRDGPTTQLAVDALLREQLQASGTRHHLVYGTGSARTAAALQAVARALPTGCAAQAVIKTEAEKLYPASAGRQKSLKYQSACESCSDPDCEHLLFTRLVQRRPPAD